MNIALPPTGSRKSAVGFETWPVGLPPGMVTTSACLAPSPS